jgi:hypothetical protein
VVRFTAVAALVPLPDKDPALAADVFVKLKLTPVATPGAVAARV